MLTNGDSVEFQRLHLVLMNHGLGSDTPKKLVDPCRCFYFKMFADNNTSVQIPLIWNTFQAHLSAHFSTPK